ncbi:MAG: hypothetical protein IK020_05660 [Clostridiales bacterium]|nr:hypothetical protein [Clostridiales bacterium]
MNASLIVSGAFAAVSVIAVVLCFTVLRKYTFHKILGASTCVYASACFFIFLIGVFREDVPTLFFILADILSTFVAAMISVVIVILMKQMAASSAGEEKSGAQAENGKNE